MPSSLNYQCRLLRRTNSEAWGWAGCAALKEVQIIYLNSSLPPMPASDPEHKLVRLGVDNCAFSSLQVLLTHPHSGPQVLGTPRPANWAVISKLNPCPWNADQPCFNMNILQLDTGAYLYVYLAFATITADFKVNISGV
jgi:hypothetical protein